MLETDQAHFTGDGLGWATLRQGTFRACPAGGLLQGAFAEAKN